MPRPPKYKTIEEFREAEKQRVLKYYHDKKQDPAFRKQRSERTVRWQKDNPDKAAAKAKRYYDKNLKKDSD